MAAAQALQVFDPGSEPFGLGKLVAGMSDKKLSGCGQAHAACRTFEQFCIQLRFEILYPPR